MTGGLIPMTLDVDVPDALRAQEAACVDLADAVRHLVDATVRTQATNGRAAAAAAQVRALTATLLQDAQDGPLGLQLCSDGRLCDHGGISAMVLDQLLGTASALRGKPGLAAYLNLAYRQRTPLGPLACEAWVAEASEWKTLVKGHLLDEDGRVTVEAEGLFVVPTWARDALSMPQSDAADFPAPTTEKE